MATHRTHRRSRGGLVAGLAALASTVAVASCSVSTRDARPATSPPAQRASSTLSLPPTSAAPAESSAPAPPGILPPAAQASIDALASLGGNQGSGAPAASTPANAPAATATADTPGSARLPPQLPLPSGARVVSVVDHGRQIAAALEIDDPQAAYDFWRTALPQRGWTVSSAQAAAAGSLYSAEVRFSGFGYGGGTQIAVQGSRASVQLERG